MVVFLVDSRQNSVAGKSILMGRCLLPLVRTVRTGAAPTTAIGPGIIAIAIGAIASIGRVLAITHPPVVTRDPVVLKLKNRLYGFIHSPIISYILILLTASRSMEQGPRSLS